MPLSHNEISKLLAGHCLNTLHHSHVFHLLSFHISCTVRTNRPLVGRPKYSAKAESFGASIASGAEGLASINLVNTAGHVINHQVFSIQQLYVLPTMCLCVLLKERHRVVFVRT